MKHTPYHIYITLFILFFSIGNCHAWKEQSHKNHFVIDAFKLLKLREKDNEYEEITSFLSYIAQGAWDEDFPADLSGIRANNHYRHAISGRGLSWSLAGLGEDDVDTLSWALSNESLDPAEEFKMGKYWGYDYTPNDLDNGNMSWEKAVNRYGYDPSSKRLAYYTLGFVLHLLQDMGVPEHVHDDPHGASGYNGFEMWVTRNYFDGDELRPTLGTLTPHHCKSINDCFIDLSKIGYSANRFQGILSADSEGTRNNSDLGRMFNIRHYRFNYPGNLKKWLWVLENYNGIPIISDSEVFSWPDDQQEFVSELIKGATSGEWWPTSGEISSGIIEPKKWENDVDGYYYLELSGDIPGHHEASLVFEDDLLVSKPHNFYPLAYLPTPLPAVADQCHGWRLENLDGNTHLYSLIGRTIIPYVIEYSAGLIKHYQEIVDHPPFIKQVSVSQGGIEKYKATWKDVVKKLPKKDNIAFIEKRQFNKTIDVPIEPGKTDISIIFSEPVKDIKVYLNGKSVKTRSYSEVKVDFINPQLEYIRGAWEGSIDIPYDGPEYDDGRIIITARDLDDHYLNIGADLDAKPGTPARRFCEIIGTSVKKPTYEWSLYETGNDENHIFRIYRELRGTAGWQGTWSIRSTHKTGPAAPNSYNSIITVSLENNQCFVRWGNNTWKCEAHDNRLSFLGHHPSGGEMNWVFVRSGNELVPDKSTFTGYISGKHATGTYTGGKK